MKTQIRDNNMACGTNNWGKRFTSNEKKLGQFTVIAEKKIPEWTIK